MEIICNNANMRLIKFYDEVVHDCDVLLVQEWAGHSSKKVLEKEHELPSHTNRHVTKYLLAESKVGLEVMYTEDRIQILKIEDKIIANVYLPAGATRERADFLIHLRDVVLSQFAEISLIVGDFNLAPTPEDGWYGNKISPWTKVYERKEFVELCERYNLTDLGQHQPWSATFERMSKGKLSAFRCDLALAHSDAWQWVDYLHDLRKNKKTDHSGVKVRSVTQ
jgi:exonuclease III|tara:strand:- start:69 stop:737 length:669 start_codon:yes stop_codon:yes gene_type:complete